MLQLLRSTPRKNTDDIALDALLNQHDLTARLSDNYRWMSRLNDFSAGLHQRIRTSRHCFACPTTGTYRRRQPAEWANVGAVLRTDRQRQ